MQHFVNKNLKIAVSVVVCELVGIISSIFTISAIPTWYATLNKPSFSPPNFVFGPVWTALYLMMGISAGIVWTKGIKKKNVRIALLFFLGQLFLNFLWSILFFGFKSPLLALIDILLLIVAIVATVMKFYKISPRASYLLIPYLSWVSFATILNFAIVLLNS